MNNVWERFETIASVEEVNEAKAQFTPIESGNYIVTLDSIEASENRDGLPMIKGRFKVEDTGKLVFYNQNLQNVNYPNMTATNIADAVNFVGGLIGEEFEFGGLGDLATRISNIAFGDRYNLKVSYATKDTELKFPKLSILAKLESADVTDIDGEDIPF